MLILLVEDTDDTREVMTLLLEFHGYEVLTARNGLEAIREATRQLPDVILMDLSMPIMDGFAATRTLRTIPETRKVPIIAVSAYVGDPDWRDRALAAGCNACIGKPVDYEKLDQALRRLVPFP